MDKLLKNKWFVRAISLLFAILLYVGVTSSQSPGTGGSSSNEGSEGSRHQLMNVKLTPEYNNQKYVISDLPDTITVQLQGSNALITKTMLSNNQAAFIDLNGKGSGTYTVPVQTTGFPNGLTVHKYPSTLGVTLSVKKSKSFPVRVGLINESDIKEGYEAADPTVSPVQVEVTGAKKVVDKIAFVEGFIDVKGVDQTIEKTVPLNIYDKKGNELNIETDPPVVKIAVPIVSTSKTVPVVLDQEGTLPEGIHLESVHFKPDRVTIFGSNSVLEGIDSVKVVLSFGDVTEDGEMQLEVSTPDGVNKITPEKVTATIDVEKTKTVNKIN